MGGVEAPAAPSPTRLPIFLLSPLTVAVHATNRAFSITRAGARDRPLGRATPAVGVARLSVCMSQVPGKAARAIDTQFDDGLVGTGSVLATLGAAGANTAPGAVAAAAYSEDQIYTVCRTL